MNKFMVSFYNETTGDHRTIIVNAKTLENAEILGKERKQTGEIISSVNYINTNVKNA